MSADRTALLDLAVAAARAAGQVLLDGRDGVRQVATKSSATDVVTQMDVAAERILVEAILAARPRDAILGEESGQRAGSSGLRWIVDPLDGTVNYLYGLPVWAVSVAVADEHGTLAGCVAMPALGEVVSAVRGGGAKVQRWGDPTAVRVPRVGSGADLASALVGTGFGYGSARRRDQVEVLRHVLPRVRDIRRAGASAVDLCWVADGRLDGYFERGLQPWDHAAGELIVRESGGLATGAARGSAVDDRLCVAAGPGVHEALRELVAGLGAHRIP